MNRLLFSLIIVGGYLCASGIALGNPGMLPNHPGYPMGAAKDPVTGQPVANDPGQSPPSLEESLQQAGKFHDAHAVNPGKEERANIVPPEEPTTINTQSEPTK